MTLKMSFSTGTQRFSNSYTMTYNSLLPNALNPVASVRTHASNGGKITASTSWLHYNHIGNVMTPAAANSTGVHTYLQHGTLGITAKPYDAAAGAYYFYQRWYDPKIGMIASKINECISICEKKIRQVAKYNN